MLIGCHEMLVFVITVNVINDGAASGERLH